jgi:hypothetical protein
LAKLGSNNRFEQTRGVAFALSQGVGR